MIAGPPAFFPIPASRVLRQHALPPPERPPMRLRPILLALAFAATTPALATPPAPAPAPTAAQAPAEAPLATLEAVVVTGIQPGPGLWQVRKGEHTLWIMATLSPLPKRIEWEPRELDALVARADRVLSSPGVDVDADIGFFGRLRLLPSALRARNNPDDKTLAEVLPPALYARWEAQKAIYLGRDRGIERRRPVFAAYALMDEALDELGLRRRNLVWERVERVAKRSGRTIVPVSVTVRVDDPRDALREFESARIDDTACMDATLKRLETDTAAMVERANAWAVGDIRTLDELRVESEIRACVLALLGTEALRKRGFEDLPRRVVAEWVRIAEESLAEHATTVAVADFQVLTADDGLLAAMRTKGYEIIAPGEEPETGPGSPAAVD